MVVKAIFENGVFRPTERISLPEHTHVEFEPRVTSTDINTSSEGMDQIYAILSERYDGGDARAAEKHNEHQP